jgi:hypothetical protein
MDFRKIRGEKDFSAKERISMFLIDEHHQRSPKKWGERERERERGRQSESSDFENTTRHT